MQGNTAVPQAGVKVYADGNVMGVSDENGKVICRFEHAGDYVLTTGDELHTYSQCRVHVTEKPFKATVTVRLTGVNGIGAIDRTLEVLPPARSQRRCSRASARTMSSRSANMATSAA